MSLPTTPRRWSPVAGTTAVGVPPPGGPPTRRPAGAARRLLEPAVLGLAGAAGVVLVAAVNPERPGHYPVCPTYALTGIYCPGCGGLRAVHALTHGDLGTALARNPVVVLGLPLAVWAYLAWARRRLLGRPATWYPSARQGWALFAVLAVFTVLRNLPWFTWLAP